MNNQRIRSYWVHCAELYETDINKIAVGNGIGKIV